MDKPLNWKQALLLQLLVGLILIFSTYTLTRSGQKVDKNDATIKELAKTVYVDEHNKELKDALKVGLDSKVDKETFKAYLDGQKEYQEGQKAYQVSTSTDIREIRNFILGYKK